ncbi:hypothetical protein BH09VER1_BH09VER1_24980 [soil metagenome]
MISTTEYPSNITAVQIRPGDWIRGDYRLIACLRYSADELAKRLSIAFESGIEDGLGEYKAAAFRAPNERQFSLTQYLQAVQGPATGICCLHDDQFPNDMDDVLESLDMDLSDLAIYESQLVISSEARLIPHALHRLHDNDAHVLVEVFPCRANASRRLRLMEFSGHKQTYWIEPQKNL